MFYLSRYTTTHAARKATQLDMRAVAVTTKQLRGGERGTTEFAEIGSFAVGVGTRQVVVQ